MRLVARFFGVLAALLAGALVAAVALEAGLRIWGARRNLLQERAAARAAGAGAGLRIMCLGESTTVNQYTVFLENALRELVPDGRFTVVDRGMTAVNSDVIVERAPDFLEDCPVDVVVCMMGCNDGAALLDYGEVRSQTVFGWMRRLRVFALFRLLWWNLEQKLAHGALFAKPQSRPQEDAPEPDDIEERLAAGPESAGLCLELAGLCESRGDVRRARALYLHAHELDPSDPRPYFKLGFYEERPADTARWTDAALGLENDSRFSFLSAAEALVFLKRFEDARKLLSRAESRYPENRAFAMRLGLVALLEDRGADAVGCFERACALDPTDLVAASSLELARAIAARRAPETHGETFVYDSAGLRKNYKALADLLEARGVRLVAAQYPTLDPAPLKSMLAGRGKVVFADNRETFFRAILERGYGAVFIDNFGGSFGHCTPEGNRLLARNIARAITAGVMGRDVPRERPRPGKADGA